ncbi:MAG TPA: hypothetical protein ENG63_05585 [Candidatus Desulfofervidus auxilii]|uniref:Polysaccharide biosynthesis protein C-terminal domain-containing protein n=1 Tax=Desulfofervidus auxilii TaxID=1621989 RepID=A0A7C0U2Z6_DESA2|nr:hypothetical protein [Candidatus Desulfofervidus auxilii]
MPSFIWVSPNVAIFAFFWLVRRGCYTQFQPMCAAVGSIFNFFLVSIGVILLWRWNKLSLFNSFLLLGIAGGITSLMLINKLKPQIKGYIGNPGLFTVFNEHRKYGQWSILAFLLYWSSGQILISGLVPIFLGLAASAAIAAIWNLYRPLSLLFQSSASIFLPVFSNWLNTGMPLIEFRKRVINLVIIFIGIFLTYGILITCFSKLILNFLYCGKYDRYILLVPLWSIALSASISINLFNMALKALGLVRYSSIIWGMSTGITLTLGIPMILFFGINGALLCLTFSYILAAVVSFLLVYKQTARDV